MAWRQPQRFAWDTCGSFWLSARRETASVANTAEQPDRLAQLKNPKTIHFLNGFSSAMAPALRGAPGTSEKTEIGAIAPPHARPPVQRRRPEAPARRRNRRTKGVFGHVAENAVPRSIFFLAWLTRDFAQNFRDARSGRDLATINRRAPWRPQRRRRKRLRSGIVPRQRRVLGIPRVDLHALAAPRPAQGWRRTDRSPQTSVAPYVGARRLFWQMAEMRSNRVYFVSPAVGLRRVGPFASVLLPLASPQAKIKSAASVVSLGACSGYNVR